MRSAEGGTAQEHGECGSSGEPDNAGRWVMAAGGEHEGHELTDEGHTTPDGGGRRPQHAHAGAAWAGEYPHAHWAQQRAVGCSIGTLTSSGSRVLTFANGTHSRVLGGGVSRV
jgi:hypothetical protein